MNHSFVFFFFFSLTFISSLVTLAMSQTFALSFRLFIILTNLFVGFEMNDKLSVRLLNAAQNDVWMPIVGLGTGGYGKPDGTGGEYWGPEQGHNATLQWLKLGGRRIDSANNYLSQAGIGTGWRASGFNRSDIFITSKLDPYGYDEALTEFDTVLQALQTDYVDLLLIHWPGDTSNDTIPPCKSGQSSWAECRLQTWKAVEKIFQQGKVTKLKFFSSKDFIIYV